MLVQRPFVLLNICIMNIFVAKLNFKTRKEELEAAFASYGAVSSAKIVRDKETGRSKGYGFVEMPDDSQALQAIASLNEKELDGREIVVKPANPKTAEAAPY
jgi:RNA recognition motif-containing protein